jgi:hypothetical protein
MATAGNRLVVDYQARIARPLDEVRRQFADMHHHAKNRVHKSLEIRVIADDGASCRYSLDVNILGLKQHDELVQTRQADGSLVAETVAGTNKGTLTTVKFRPDGEAATLIDFRLDAPVSGFKKLIKPLFTAGVRREVRKAFAEDRYDLEVAGYPRKAA